jgi:orotate phosphoribosyltransferase
VNDRDLLIQILRQRSIAFGDFVLASGRRSTYYVDARKTTMSAAGLAVIGRLGLQLIRERGWQPAAVGGLTMGADPVAYAIARASAELPPIIDGFSVRKAAKEHGTKQRVEGNFDRGIQVVVVEDVITSGSSALQAIEAIRAEGGNPLGVVAVVDRLQGGAEAITKAAGLDVVSMTTVRDFGIQPT